MIKNKSINLPQMLRTTINSLRIKSQQHNVDLHCYIHKNVSVEKNENSKKILNICIYLIETILNHISSGSIFIEVSQKRSNNILRGSYLLIKIHQNSDIIENIKLDLMWDTFLNNNKRSTQNLSKNSLEINKVIQGIQSLGGSCNLSSTSGLGNKIEIKIPFKSKVRYKSKVDGLPYKICVFTEIENFRKIMYRYSKEYDLDITWILNKNYAFNPHENRFDFLFIDFNLIQEKNIPNSILNNAEVIVINNQNHLELPNTKYNVLNSQLWHEELLETLQLHKQSKKLIS